MEDRRLVHQLRDNLLRIYLLDNMKAREMQSDGTYVGGNPELMKSPSVRSPCCSSPGSPEMATRSINRSTCDRGGDQAHPG